jgi:hypothetical protein
MKTVAVSILYATPLVQLPAALHGVFARSFY